MAAFGAAWSLYGYRLIAPASEPAALRFLAVTLLVAVLVSAALCALQPYPLDVMLAGRPVRRRRGLAWAAASWAFGCTIGVAALGSGPFVPSWGVPAASVTGFSGAILEDPRLFPDGRGLVRVVLRNVRTDNGTEVSSEGKLTVFVPAQAVPNLMAGGRGGVIRADGAVLPANADFPAAFRATSAQLVTPAPRPERLRSAWRRSLLDRLESLEWGGLALALLFGVRDYLDAGLAQAYTNAGSAHVLALSGMHLAVISALVALALKRILGLKAAAAAGAACIIAYVAFVGPQPSLVRAVLMFVLSALAILGGLPRPSLALLGAAFLVQLGVDPGSATSLSFVLSYLALAGILTVGAATDELLDGLVPAFVRTPLAASVGAFLVTAPVVVAAFGSLRPVGIPAAFFLVPLASLFMVAALGYLVLVSVVPVAAQPLGLALTYLFRFNDVLVSQAARAPDLSLQNTGMAVVLSLAVSILLLYLRYRRAQTRMRLDPFD